MEPLKQIVHNKIFKDFMTEVSACYCYYYKFTYSIYVRMLEMSDS